MSDPGLLAVLSLGFVYGGLGLFVYAAKIRGSKVLAHTGLALAAIGVLIGLTAVSSFLHVDWVGLLRQLD